MKSFNPSRRGDSGSTVIGGTRVSKSSPIIKLVGKFDTFQSRLSHLYQVVGREVNADEHKLAKIKSILETLIHQMYVIMSTINGYSVCATGMLTEIVDNALKELKFKQLRNFILPVFDDDISVGLNALRADVRELELYFTKFPHLRSDSQDTDETDAGTLENIRKLELEKYLNRLSSLFYAMLCYHSDTVTTVSKKDLR